VYEVVEDLVAGEVPEWLRLKVSPKAEFADPILREEYAMYAEKLDERTVQLLRARGLVRPRGGSGHDLYTTPGLGLMLLALLAQICAGATKVTITDRGSAYAWLAKYAFEKESREEKASTQSQKTEIMKRLNVTCLSIFEPAQIDLRALIAMREREAAGDGKDYRKFRRNYLSRIQTYADRIVGAQSPRDVAEIERQYRIEMQDDVKFLQDALQDNVLDAILSKETGIGIATQGASLLTGVPGIAAAIGALLGAMGVGKKFARGKQKVLFDHATAWVYLAHRMSRRHAVGRIPLSSLV
jgi:hypothetical protein